MKIDQFSTDLDCRAAQQLLGQSSGGAETAHLRRHLADCADCRRFQAQRDAALLADLLAHEPMQAAVLRPLTPNIRVRRRRNPWIQFGVPALLGIAIVLLTVSLGRLLYAGIVISRSVAAMQAAPTPLLARPDFAAAAVAPLPSAIIQPSPTTPSGPTREPMLIAISPDAAIGEPATIAPSSTPTAGYLASPTALRLPAAVAALPTLMPTLPVRAPSGDAIHVLLLGSDRRPGEGWTTRSDAMVVVRLEPQSQRVALLSLPRDLIVPIPGYGQARINSATVYGDLYPELGGGIELARRTVSGYLGLPIDHVLRVDFQAFIAGIDAIGGVDILVEEELYDPQYPTMDYGYTTAYFAPGMQSMDGATALVFARVRHMDSNYARNRRQQQVLLAIIDKVRQRDPITQVELLSEVSVALRDHVQTDMALEEMVGLAWAFRSVLPQNVERYALDETMVSEGVLAEDPYATFAAPSTVDALVRRFVTGNP